MLRAVAGADRHLAPQYEGHVAVPAEHVPGLADLVEQLVGRHPHEVGVHELHDRLEPAVQRDASAQARERVFADGCAEDPVRIELLEPSSGAVGASVETVHVFTHHHDCVVGLHPASHHRCHDVDELPLADLAREGVAVRDVGVVELAQVAADPDVDEGRVGPLRRPDPPLSRLAAGQRFQQYVARLGHRPLRARPCLLDAGLADDPPAHEVPGDLRDGVTLAPLLLLVLGAVAEGAAGERAVLVEVAVGVGLDHRRATAGAHVRDRLLHGEVDGQRIHPVDLPARDAEAESPSGQPRLRGCLGDLGGDGVLVVLDEEADGQAPGCGEVERLEGRPDVDGTVSEVGHRHGVRTCLPVCPCETGGLRHTAADDGVGPHRAGLLPLQMHRATAPVAETPGQPADLGKGAQQHRAYVVRKRRGEVEALRRDVRERFCQELVVTTVRTVHRVRTRQRQGRADCSALLADAGVRWAVHQPRGGQLEHVLLEGPDQHEVVEHRHEQRRLGLVPIGGRGHELDPGRGRHELLVLGHHTLRGRGLKR